MGTRHWPDDADERCEELEQENDQLRKQLAKANERVEKAEKEAARLKGIFYKWKEEKDNAVWESDTVFNSLMASSQYYLLEEGLEHKEWFKKHVECSIAKFALEQKIEGAFKFADFLDSNNFSAAIAAKESGFFQLVETLAKQLSKEQDDEV